MNRGTSGANNSIVLIDFSERNTLMLRKSALLLRPLNLVFRSLTGQTSASSDPLVALPQHPLSTDREAWHVYWPTQGQPWRTEPEIDRERQAYLAERRTISPNLERGIFPFKDAKLTRADVEWLLATHENGRGPVVWKDESQRDRKGLDLRGADLRQADLRGLPLARLCGGIPKDDWLEYIEQRTIYPVMYLVPQYATSKQQRTTIAMLIAQADLIGIHLEEANLTGAHLEGAHLCDAHLERAYLMEACLESADLAFAHLKEADLTWASLVEAELTGAHLEDVDLNCATLAISSSKQGIGPQIIDVHWGETNLAVVDWSPVKKLGEEHEAEQKKTPQEKIKSKFLHLNEYKAAVRANRQLAIALLNQGINEEAIRFAYRAQVLQKRVWWFQMLQRGVRLKQRGQAFGAWLFSWFLFLIAGYGYRLWRSFLTYALVIIGFTTIYYVLGVALKPPLSLVDALGLSMTSFHGRGFFPGVTQLNDTLTILASVEAFVGLILEATFIATLTQRFFGK
jgi:uncharacterized protein YjbI with pentapeptide repeats